MEEDHIFLFLVLKDEFNKYFFQDFLIFFFQRVGNLDWIFFFFFFFFESELRSTSPTPIVLILFFSLFFLIENLFFFRFEDLFIIKKWRRWRWRWSKSDEDLFMMIFFKKKKPILWMRITLAGSWCGLLDKSLLNSYKKIISISNGFIHWNESKVLTQCP